MGNPGITAFSWLPLSLDRPESASVDNKRAKLAGHVDVVIEFPQDTPELGLFPLRNTPTTLIPEPGDDD